MYMFDTLGSGYGGTGKKFDWNVLKDGEINKLFFLSGGIDPMDAEGLKTFSKKETAQKLFAIDLNSKFEVSAGVKDIGKVEEMMKELR
jgi:phosphoribosylanthranilate isomerase